MRDRQLIDRKQRTGRALVLEEDRLYVDAAYPPPTLRPGEVLVRVRKAGVCATDLELIKGYKGGYRGVLGHEFVGQVVDAPDHSEWLGKRVVSEINIGCDQCDRCRRGLAKHCRRRRTVGIAGCDGVFADYVALPAANLHHVPDDVTDEQAVFVEPLAAALQIFEQVHIAPHHEIYLLGDGRLGLLLAQVLAAANCNLTVFGRHAEKLAMVELTHGVQTVLVDSPEAKALVEQEADVVVDATGSHSGFRTALHMVRPGGVLVLKSTVADQLENFDLSKLVVDEITVVGSRCGPFAPALRLLQRNAVQVAPLISGRYSLDDGVQAIQRAGERGVIKILIEMASEPWSG